MLNVCISEVFSPLFNLFSYCSLSIFLFQAAAPRNWNTLDEFLFRRGKKLLSYCSFSERSSIGLIDGNCLTRPGERFLGGSYESRGHNKEK